MSEQYFEDIVAYMDSHMEEYLTLTQISRELGISESYINTVFLRYAQIPPKRYYIHMKIRQACELLASSGLRVNQVSERLGYQNPFYFSKAFKQVMGMSPKQYLAILGSGC